MEDKIIDFETARLAKEKEFFISKEEDYAFTALYPNKKGMRSMAKKYYPNFRDIYFNDWDCYLFPTQSLLQRWIREEHDIHLNITHSYTKSNIDLGFVLTIESANYKYLGGFTYNPNYEDILELGLQEALKLIKLNV